MMGCINSHIVDIYLTGDLAFQAMALGKESMAGWWCMQCKANYVSPLLHCEIGIGNVIFELLRDIINEHRNIRTGGRINSNGSSSN